MSKCIYLDAINVVAIKVFICQKTLIAIISWSKNYKGNGILNGQSDFFDQKKALATSMTEMTLSNRYTLWVTIVSIQS